MAKPIELDDNMPEYNDPERGTSIVEGIDLANLPGKKRLQLVRNGDLSVDQFVTPPNMPGKTLKELRERNRETMSKVILDAEPKDNPYKVGDFVLYKDSSTEVLKVDGNKVLVTVVDGDKEKKVWVNYVKVKKG